MKKVIAALIIASGVATASARAEQTPAYLDASLPIEQRVEDALSRMTTAEKIAIIHAQSKFSSPGVSRLGIPGLWTTDGPHGIRPEVLWDEWEQAGWTNDSCTAFPALTCLAATWNPEMSHLYGRSIGEEARYRGKDILLGPGVNMLRTPLNGRNFEYMGEDPYLASVMVVPYIKGVQENGVATCVKHYALNNNEVSRHSTNVIISERTLREYYLPAYKTAVDSGAWSIMAAYNLYQDEHLCHNQRLLNDILKDEWGFDGVVVSDWGGVHDTWQAIHNGLDLEFGSWTNGLTNGSSNAYDNYYMAAPYLQLINEGKVGTEELDDKARRVLRLIFRTSMNPNRPFGSMCSPEHSDAARRIGGEGMVLLKNRNGLLPFSPDTRKVLVVGENAIKMMTVGGGSSSLKARYEVLPLDGLRAALGDNVEVNYARGYVGDVTGEYNGVTTGQNLTDDRSAEELIAEAVEAAKEADYVVFVGGLNKSAHQDCEDSDRLEYNLPYGQDAVIEALAAVNPNLVVVNISGNPVAMPWINKVGAVLQGWYFGSEAGNIIADVLTGKVNPSGKLPFSIPASLADVPAHNSVSSYPGIKRADDSGIFDMTYDEGIFVGYRFLDANKRTPVFPFGYGLSYTTFSYGKPSVDHKKGTADDIFTVSVDVTNTGAVAGYETVQLYISDVKSSLPRPVNELKGFSKVYLQPGETATVSFPVTADQLQYFDDTKGRWVVEPGKFKARTGASSRDFSGEVTFEVE